MNEVLYIRLNNDEQATIWWLVWSVSEKEIIASGELSSAEQLTLLAEKAKGREVIAIAPSQDVLLKSITVPGKSTRAIRQAAPYMLEEELAQDVEQLFFAYATGVQSDDDSNCFVAVVKKDLMNRWNTWLAQANITCQVLIPEVLLLPVHEGGWSTTTVDGQVLIRQSAWEGMAIDSSLCELVASQWHELEQRPTLYSYSKMPDVISGINIEHQPEELPLALMAQQERPKFNLLQGAYAVKNKHTKAITAWAVAASLALFAVLLTVGNQGVELYALKSQNENVEDTIITTYKEAFPETKRVRVSTIKSQLKSKLNGISGGGTEQGFLAMMAKLQVAYAQVPNLKITAIKFDEKRGEIRLNASASDFQAFDRFKAAVEKEQLDVAQGAQNSQGDRVTGSISIKGRS